MSDGLDPRILQRPACLDCMEGRCDTHAPPADDYVPPAEVSDGLDLAAIRARAKAAHSTDDRWYVEDGDESLWVDHGGQGSSASCLVDRWPIWANGMPEHIAGMDPATTLALVDELETLRAKIAAVEALPTEDAWFGDFQPVGFAAPVVRRAHLDAALRTEAK